MIQKTVHSIWKKEEMLHQQKESIILSIYKKSNKIDFSDFRAISLLSTSYEISIYILLWSLTPHTDDITGDHQCAFQHNRSTTADIAHSSDTRVQWERASAINQLHRSFCLRNEELYNIFLEFGTLMKLIKLIKMCLNKPIVN